MPAHADGLESTSANLTDTVRRRVDIRRAKLHEDIDRSQRQLLAMDGSADSLLNLTTDSLVNQHLTDVYTVRVDRLQDSLEVAGKLDHRLKVKYLTGIDVMLRGFMESRRLRRITPEHGILLFHAYEEMAAADLQGNTILPIVENYPYQVGNILINHPSSVFFENRDFREAGIATFRKFCALYPEKVLPRLEEYSDAPFADSLIRVSARRYPNQFYDYAAAYQTRVGRLIRKSEDTLVRTILSMAESRSGRIFFPFLDEVMTGRITMPAISRVMTDSLLYYRLLVNTQIRYAERMRNRDTPMVHHEITRMLKRRAEEVFINQINALHDEPDPVRFRILDDFTAQELYYLIVTGEEIIYTSSYKGVYNRMFERMRTPAGDTLLLNVRFDRFKKFIKMAAGYNRLDHFLSTMPDSSAQRLMIAFARGLEKSGGLEEAVDVADSYGSITTPSVKGLIDQEIATSLEASRRSEDRRTFVIYDILENIFKSSADTSIDLSARLGIPPVYKIDYKALTDSAGKVVQLVFFYGDKDGIESFANFMGLFNGRPEWQMIRNKEWVEIRSQKGRPVTIYANLPLDNSKGDDPDARAQASLINHLEKQGIAPTVVIHRGHSYHLKYTLKQLPASAKIVILGSCGGFHNLDDVLNRCPEAHIISSKEVGTRTVNEPILRSINEDLRNGRDIEWIPMWKGLSAQFTTPESRERFDNYIPPHKNLGALFIKAYQRAMQQQP